MLLVIVASHYSVNDILTRILLLCKYCISGQEKTVDWTMRKATTFLQEHSLAVNKCLGKKYKSEKLFMCLLMVQMCYGSALWSVHFRVFALERFCDKGFLRNLSGTKLFVRLREVSALEDVCFRGVPLYL